MKIAATTLLAILVLTLLTGVYLGRRISADTKERWRLSNYEIHKETIRVAGKLRKLAAQNQDAEWAAIRHTTPGTQAALPGAVQIGYQGRLRAEAIDLKEILEMRIDPRAVPSDKKRDRAALYETPTYSGDIFQIADDLEKMNGKLPKHRSLWAWTEAELLP